MLSLELSPLLAAELSTLIEQYNLEVKRIDHSEALLLGRSYALLFQADLDGLEVFYIDWESTGLTVCYTLRTLTVERFTADDVRKFGTPLTASEKITAELRVYASGLLNRCRDVLAGEKHWLDKERWRSKRIRPATLQWVASLLDRKA